jgi:hypothetical protein
LSDGLAGHYIIPIYKPLRSFQIGDKVFARCLGSYKLGFVRQRRGMVYHVQIIGLPGLRSFHPNDLKTVGRANWGKAPRGVLRDGK